MASESASNLLEALYLAWVAGVGALHPWTGDALVREVRKEAQEEAANDEALGALMRLLWHVREHIHDCEEGASGIGFSPTRNALWCVTADLTATLGLNQPKRTHLLQHKVYGKRAFDLFRERRPFSRMSALLVEAEFWPRILQTPGIKLAHDAHVIPELLDIAQHELERLIESTTLPGIPIAGVRNAVLWISFRSEDEIRHYVSQTRPDLTSLSLASLLRDCLTQTDRAEIIDPTRLEAAPSYPGARTFAYRDPLLIVADQELPGLPSLSSGPTDTSTVSKARGILTYLRRGDPQDGARADNRIAEIAREFAESPRAATRVCRSSDRENILVQERGTTRTDIEWSFWFRRYFTPSGEIDDSRAHHAADLYRQLHTLRTTRKELPAFELTARTATGLYSGTIGECLRDRYTTPSSQSDVLARTALRERVAQLVAETAKAIHEEIRIPNAQAIDYEKTLSERLSSLASVDAIKLFGRRRHLAQDIRRIADALLGAPQVPYVEGSARHVWFNGRQVMLADIDIAMMTLAHPAHLHASVYCAPEWHLPLPSFSDETSALAAMCFLLDEVSCALGEQHQHELCAYTRRDLPGLVRNLQIVASGLRKHWSCAALIHELDEKRLFAARARRPSRA